MHEQSQEITNSKNHRDLNAIWEKAKEGRPFEVDVKSVYDYFKARGKVSNFNSKKNSFITQCPAHDDKNPSLSVGLRIQVADRKNLVLLYCHAGCSIEQITNALGINKYALFAARQGFTTYDPFSKKPLRLNHTSRFNNYQEQTKTFSHSDYNAFAKAGYFYNSEKLATAIKELAYKDINLPFYALVVEGESKADIFNHYWNIGNSKNEPTQILAISSSSGKNNLNKANWSSLAKLGVKNIIMFADKDALLSTFLAVKPFRKQFETFHFFTANQGNDIVDHYNKTRNLLFDFNIDGQDKDTTKFKYFGDIAFSKGLTQVKEQILGNKLYPEEAVQLLDIEAKECLETIEYDELYAYNGERFLTQHGWNIIGGRAGIGKTQFAAWLIAQCFDNGKIRNVLYLPEAIHQGTSIDKNIQKLQKSNSEHKVYFDIELTAISTENRVVKIDFNEDLAVNPSEIRDFFVDNAIDLIVFDTLDDWTVNDSGNNMQKVKAVFRKFNDLLPSHVTKIALLHTRKSNIHDRFAIASEKIAGSSANLGKADTAIVLLETKHVKNGQKEKTRRLGVVKQRYCKESNKSYVFTIDAEGLFTMGKTETTEIDEFLSSETQGNVSQPENQETDDNIVEIG